MRKTRRTRLWRKNPYCHWCGVKTELRDLSQQEGAPPGNSATVDHLYSRFNPIRFTVEGSKAYVIACWDCNQRRSAEEVRALTREEMLARSEQGFRLNKGPDGKKIITNPLKTLDEVLDIFSKNGIVLDNEERQRKCSTVAG